ncbi:hypothetical protein, partial [Methanolobus psychrotolerans]|uniref:hypothetical protein n=1 Tax=Methanolobus psychrotolerans TaxID=1874706 RepID=UPI00101AD3DD
MKRLTISMSDELFDKLDLIENKSLFIRKLIERELDILDNAPEDNISVPWTERVAILVDDVSTIFSRLELIERKFSGVNNTFENTQTPPDKINIQIPIVDNKIINDDPMLLIANDEEEAYGIISIENGNTETILLPDTQSVTNEKVELIKPVTTNNKQIEQEFAAHAQEMIVDNIPGQKIGPEKMVQYDPEENIHEIKLSKMISEKISKPEQEDVAFGLPGQEPQMQVPDKVTEEKTFAIPELKLPEQEKQETELVMPELKLPEQEKQETELVMPELKLPEQTKQDAEFVMPELKLPEQTKQETEFV